MQKDDRKKPQGLRNVLLVYGLESREPITGACRCVHRSKP